jgi:hypothetical protein
MERYMEVRKGVYESPTYWFVLMETALRRGDFERAAEARAQLEALGVTVKFRKNSIAFVRRRSLQARGVDRKGKED